MKLTNNIHLLKHNFEITLSPDNKIPRFVNSLIIFEDKITLIDTGIKGSEIEIFSYVKQQGRNIKEIDTIILSHAHPDHIGSAAKIKEVTNCKILAHKDEINWIKDIELQYQQRPVPGFFNLVDAPVEVDEYLENDQLVKAGKDITLRIIHSPGHSKGSLNILFEEDRMLFTADSVPLKNDIPNYDNYPDIIKTLSKIKTSENYNMLLSSWTKPLVNKSEIEAVLLEGEKYMQKIDNVVKGTYVGEESEPHLFCGQALVKLNLPPFLKTPVVDNAFRSHL